ncbi:hypothetical protein ABZ942_18750 [Nocardia sp. NPDC046473]|uniref:hypothetical protein n=1 Tax=Nocardia sp. NPDC046473 TaxID=3155733 RepID=UPI0033E1715C
MTALDNLQRLLPPPQPRPAAVDWNAVERDVGLALPDDYKQLVDTYGPVEFSSTVRLAVPGHPAPSLDLLWWIREARDRLGDPDFPPRWDQIPDGFSLDPQRLIAWGKLGGGEYCLWHTTPDPEAWRVVVGSNAGWGFYPGTLTGFLVALLTKTLPAERFFDDITDLVDENGIYYDLHQPDGTVRTRAD